MKNKALIAGIACLASAAMADAREAAVVVDQDQMSDRKQIVLDQKQPQMKIDLLVDVLKTRLN
ncbi:MAG: hypothetical protein CMI03_14390 [Oceanospirillaceae bacterium]|uniref:hypothetical protein n=1 Tax=unclassified Thalassolituus TaxID=2624967 RepID=UPI000C0968CB|nr:MULTISPECIES: hypothetical protein [unclassified Thalassolituus]MAK92829.1 hypothetical protein [Thalassolituus sp.]MBS53925.1 hypothetical protein [Oceanospirillaceae bacterium]|tara:strand:- start:90 stop:278 length:189 start_codon:yes stop_codon:yes gene_type:complete